MEKNERETYHPEPNVAAHPGLRSTDSPNAQPLSYAEQASIKHQSVSNGAESEPDPAASARACGTTELISNIDGKPGNEDGTRRQHPRAVGSVDPHAES